MGQILGALNLSDSDATSLNLVGQRAVWEIAQQYVDAHNAALQEAYSVFVSGETEDFKEIYYLPGGGRLQKRGGRAQSGSKKVEGKWEVGYPLDDFGDQVSGDDVTMAYMTVQELERHIDAVMIRDINTVRHEMFYALFHGTAYDFEDPRHGTISVKPLAAGESTVKYPPVIGAETEATDNHYLESNYTAANITDTNNPYETMRAELEEHFGEGTAYDNMVVFIHPDQVAKTKALTDFDKVEDNFIRQGANADIPINLPTVPGRIIGRASGVWVVQWRWIPTGYLLGINLEADKPLKQRRDTTESGLGTGLQLVETDDRYPFQASHWRHRFGFGVGNRLNGVVMELGTGGSYSAPSTYA